MNAKAVTVIAILVVLIGLGGFYAGQKYKLVPASQPVLPTAQTVVTTTPVPQVPGTPVGQTATPTPDDKAAVIAAVKASEVARVGADANASTYTVSLIQGDYAKGMANASGGGAIWFAAKVGGVWEVVFIGNGIIQCSDLTSYPNFPNKMIPECWDAATNKMVTR